MTGHSFSSTTTGTTALPATLLAKIGKQEAAEKGTGAATQLREEDNPDMVAHLLGF
jgi:hypothetical protein